MEESKNLKAVLAQPGPTATIILAAPSATESASEQLEVRWNSARHRLRELGIGDGELKELEDLAEGLHHEDGATLVVIKSAHHDAWTEFLDDPVTRDLVVLGELARLGSVLESRQQSVPHMMVVVDRSGADVIAISEGSEVQSVEVQGSSHHIHRGNAGGWSQRRFQQRAENSWEANARNVADLVVDMASKVDPRFIAIAGDVRAVTFLLDDLPTELAEISLKLDGQSPELIAEQTVRAAADIVARDTVVLLEEFKEASGHGRSAVGAVQTLAALSDGRVETLLIQDDPEDDRTAMFERDGLRCATTDPTAAEVGFDDEVSGRLVDVAIRSALLGDSEVRMLPSDVLFDDGVGALLRW